MLFSKEGNPASKSYTSSIHYNKSRECYPIQCSVQYTVCMYLSEQVTYHHEVCCNSHSNLSDEDAAEPLKKWCILNSSSILSGNVK